MLSKIKSISINHWQAIVLALIAAIIIAWPQAYFRYDNADTYKGIGITGAGDDEVSWLSRVREAMDGHKTFSCIYLKDGKDEPYLVQPLGTNIFASPGALFSLGINETILFSKFFFSFVVFLIIYAFIYLFSKEKLAALASTTLLVLGRDILSRGGITELITTGITTTKFLNFARPVNPLMTYFFFFGFLLFFWLFIERRQWRWGILSALMLGLSFYDYFYTWTLLYVFCGLLFIISLLRKKTGDAKRILWVLLGAAVIAIPYFFNMYQVIAHPNYTETAQRFGLISGRYLDHGLLAPLLFIVVLLSFPRRLKDRYFFALALAAAPLIALNQQIITGKNLSNVHYHWYFTWPIAIIFFVMILLFWLYQKKRAFKIVAASIVFTAIASGIVAQWGSYLVNESGVIEKQRYGQVMDWLDKNGQKEEVVFSDEETSSWVVIFTPLNIFYHFKAQSCLAAPQERLLGGLFLNYRLDDVERNEAEQFFFKNRGDISHFLYGMYYNFTAGDYAGIPDEIILGLIEKYQNTFNLSTAEMIKNSFDKYEVKYAVWDKEAKPHWRLDQYEFLKKAAEFNDFTIFRYDTDF